MQKKNFNRKKVHFTGGLIVLVILSSFFTFFNLLEGIDGYLLDLKYKFFNRTTKASDKVVVVDIDEQSLKLLSNKYGRWPWPRNIYKTLIEYFSQVGSKAILFDILFTEPTLNSNDDKDFAITTSFKKNVSHSMNFLEERADGLEEQLELPPKFGKKFGINIEDVQEFYEKYKDYSISLNRYLDILPHFHVVTSKVEESGIFRRTPLMFKYGNFFFPSLPLKAVFLYLENVSIKFKNNYLYLLKEGKIKRRIPINNGLFNIHYYRKSFEPKIISIAPVIYDALMLQKGVSENLKVDFSEFEDKIIIIGTSAAGLHDLKATPISGNYPGALIHATVISNILLNDFLRTIPPLFSWIISTIIVILIYSCTFFLSVRKREFFPLLVIISYVTIAVFLFRFFNIELKLSVSILLGLFSHIEGLSYISFFENKEKRKLHSTLVKYVSPQVAKELIEKGSDVRAEIGNTVTVTVLFSDIRGFTGFSEKHKPEEVVKKLNLYLSDMTDAIFNFGGTLDKFIGDAIMAYWGAPIAEPNSTEKAVRCALYMQKILSERRKKSDVENGYSFNAGIGINSGTAVIGNIGSSNRLDYTIIGDAVNVASRLEGLTSYFKIPLIISQSTYINVKDRFLCRRLGKGHVRGRIGQISLYEPMVEFGDKNLDFYETVKMLFENALTLCESEKYSDAVPIFDKLYYEFNDNLSLTFKELFGKKKE